MKNSEFEKLEQINEERKLSKEVKEKISKQVINNFYIALDILIFFIVLIIAGRILPKHITLIIYKVSSIIWFIFTLILLELAYYKDNDETAVYGIEMLFLSITTLLTPYFLVGRPSVVTSIVGSYFAAYYILKNLHIYKKEKRNFLREHSDIPQIIKKESQDELAIEEKMKQAEQAKKEKQEEKEKTETPKRKRGRPKKKITKSE